MKQNDIKDLPNLDIENYENIFNVYQDENDVYFYNLLNKIVFPDNLPVSYFIQYVTNQGDTYPYISYKTLGSPNLWWVIALANNIDNPTALPEPGTVLRVPSIGVVQTILEQISTR
jgi:hypothetical protein